jgi:hypothetical protein
MARLRLRPGCGFDFDELFRLVDDFFWAKVFSS